MEKDKKEVHAEYERRHAFWSGQALSQPGYSQNLFFTINLGFLAYLISERKKYSMLHFALTEAIDLKLVLYFSVLTLVFVSLIIGASSLISRLYDLRITRFIVWVRKRAYKKYAKLLSDSYIDFSDKSTVVNFVKAVFCEINFTKEKDFDDWNSLETNFNSLRVQQKLLGQFTWATHKFHIILILCAALLYSISTIFGW